MPENGLCFSVGTEHLLGALELNRVQLEMLM